MEITIPRLGLGNQPDLLGYVKARNISTERELNSGNATHTPLLSPLDHGYAEQAYLPATSER